jgi:F420-dependent hydroxymycolic acid dehydrogenase
MGAGARDSGKNLAEMPVLIEQYVVVSDNDQAKPAAELLRFGPKAFKTYFNIRDPATVQQQAEAQVPLEQVLSSWAVGTEPSTHVNKLIDLLDSGATIVNVHCPQPDQRAVLEFYGSRVLPALREHS